MNSQHKNTLPRTLLVALLAVLLSAGLFRSCVAQQQSQDTTSEVVSAPKPARTSQATWWNKTWKHRKKLYLENIGQAEDLIDFPVLIHLTEKNFDFTLTRSDGFDIRFIDSDGVTVLSYEIESWNQNQQQANIWVKVPKIDAQTNSDAIFLYYGNLSAPDGQDVHGTWNDDFISVWHLSDYASGDTIPFVKDSTKNNKTLIVQRDQSKVVATASAAIGPSSVFFHSGREGFLQATGDIEFYKFEPDQDFSVSTWARSDASGNETYMGLLGNLAVHENNYYRVGWGIQATFTNLRTWEPGFYVQKGCCSALYPEQRVIALNDGAFHYLAGARTTKEMSFLTDKTLRAVPKKDIPTSYQSMKTVEFNFTMGKDPMGQSYFSYTGFIDETRVSKSGRSASWFQAEYLTGIDRFVNYDDPVITFEIREATANSTEVIIDATVSLQNANATALPDTLVQLYGATPSATRVALIFSGIEQGRSQWRGTLKIPKSKLGSYQKFQGALEYIRRNQPGQLSTHFINLPTGFTNQGHFVEFQADFTSPATLEFSL